MDFSQRLAARTKKLVFEELTFAKRGAAYYSHPYEVALEWDPGEQKPHERLEFYREFFIYHCQTANSKNSTDLLNGWLLFLAWMKTDTESFLYQMSIQETEVFISDVILSCSSEPSITNDSQLISADEYLKSRGTANNFLFRTLQKKEGVEKFSDSMANFLVSMFSFQKKQNNSKNIDINLLNDFCCADTDSIQSMLTYVQGL